MSSLMTSYSMYFNRKYDRVGALFQGRYKAAFIDNDSYYMHISRYIHLNPIDISKPYEAYPFSSYSSYMSRSGPEWLNYGKVLEMFASPVAYKLFTAEYADSFHVLEELYTLE